MEIFDSFFQYQVKYMYAGIEATLKKETAHLCALALSTYTEVLGGLRTGNLKEKKESRRNYEAFLEYLGQGYVDLNEKLIQNKTTLYESVRSKLVHEFSPRPSYGIWVSEPNDSRIGIEYIGFHLNFHLREYYRDLKKGVDKYYNELKQWKENQEIFGNFLKSTVEGFIDN